jgi:hypothetical protein
LSIVAALGVVGSVLVSVLQGQTNRKAIEKEAADRAAQLELLRAQVEGAQEEREEQRRAYVSVDQGPKSGGERTDGYQFIVQNAGPATARHLEVRINNSRGEAVSSEKVNPHILQMGERGVALLDVPRQLRQEPLVVFVEWVDPEQRPTWDEEGLRKEREVGPLVPVG